VTAGFYGKVHTHGDFIQRGLPRHFLDPWDAWLQQSLAASREQLGEQWLDRYLVAPVWRFALSAGICGDPAWLGLLMPSVDRVGRYFPLTLATPLDAGRSASAAFLLAEEWFRQAGALLVTALEDGFDLEHFQQRVNALPPPPTETRPALAGQAALRIAGCEHWNDVFARLAPGLLEMAYAPASLWATQRMDAQECSLLLARGLPAPGNFSLLLDFEGTDARWQRMH